jgi:hypothetical protein
MSQIKRPAGRMHCRVPLCASRRVLRKAIRGCPANRFTFDKDTITGRKWRVVDGWLQCEAMGGWKPVFEVADSTDLARTLAWLSGASVKATRQEMQARRCPRRPDRGASR